MENGHTNGLKVYKKRKKADLVDEKAEPSPSRNGASNSGKVGASGGVLQSPTEDRRDAERRRQRLQQERRQLPIWSARAKLLEQVRATPVLIVIGETGSGKTTQIPQFLDGAGFTRGGSAIAVTQPRRVAAVTVARRVAQEMGVPLGDRVGYAVRFDDKSSAATRVKYMTDGMLLREALLDPLLRRYKVVIVDEAHERTVQTDVLLGLLKGVAQRRTDGFRLLVMSATLDAARFTDYFAGSKAAYVQGRQHAVEVLYTAAPEDSYLDAALNATLQIHLDEGPGDILVFLTGQEEIDSLARLLRDRAGQLGESAAQLVVAPIYAMLPPEQQMMVFEPTPPGVRKVVIATNIAETSITIPGVRYVVDPGFVKARAYSAKLGAESLQVVPISQAQARQRSGRAGREAPGKAFRLYTEAAFRALAAATLPEIQRTNLAATVLQLKALGIQDVLGFDFMDSPPRAALVRSLELLYALGALDGQGALARPLGERMARLPVEPMYAKVLLAAAATGCGEEALAVVAMVSTDPVFYTPMKKREEAAEARQRFVSREGDHVTLLNIFRMYSQVGRAERGRWCSDNFVNARALKKAADIHAQLAQYLAALGLPVQAGGEDTTALRRALTAGLFPNAARRQMDGSYKVMATGQVVALHPSSVLAGKKTETVVFNEVVRTTRHYARDVTAIEAPWLPELAPAFFKSGPAAVSPGAG